MFALLLLTQLWAEPKCYTKQDLMDGQCKVLCVRDNHTGGKWGGKACVCFDVQDDGFLDNKIILGVRLYVPDDETYHFTVRNDN